MYRKKNKLLSMILVFFLVFYITLPAQGAPSENLPFEIQSKSAILVDYSTGEIIYEKNADEKLPIASVTKVMTLLLLMEAIDSGRLKLTDEVTVSERASGMGGSQVFLESNATYTVEDLMKSIVIASANDASVAMAEKLYGSEELFVQKMNEKARALGMSNTNFVNCTGLPEENHYSTARDVSIMSRELLKHPTFHKWSTIWIDYLRHPKDRETILTNTNRLIKFYDGADGIKTGSTTEAKYCLSASAKRGSLRLIAVLLAAPTSKIRFAEAQKLMDHGFANYQSLTLLKENQELRKDIRVTGGKSNSINAVAGKEYNVLVKKGEEKGFKTDISIPDVIPAPVEKGQVIGEAVITQSGKEIARIPIVSDREIKRANYFDNILKILDKWIQK